MTYGEVLSYYIEKTGIKPAELARRINVSRGQISDLVSGRTKDPSLSRAKAIADALGVTLQEMADLMDMDKED